VYFDVGFNAFRWRAAPAPRAITGRYGDGWNQGAEAWRWNQVPLQPDTATVVMNALRAIDAARAAASEFNYRGV